MRIMGVQNVTPGMVVGKTVFGSSQQTLLHAGTILTEKYIGRLQELEVAAIYVVDEKLGPIDIEDVVCDQTRLEAGKLTKSIIQKTKLGQSFDDKKVKTTINKIIEDLLHNKDLLVKLTDIRSLSDYSYFHSVNVAILSGIVGINLGYSENKLQELMIGALFHDIGKTILFEDEPYKNQTPWEEPSEKLKSHTTLGYEIIKQNGNFSLLSAHVCLQHHERYDGKGFPRMLSGNDIHEYGRIIAITNAFDLLTSVFPDNSIVPMHQAVEQLLLDSGTLFDSELVNVFIQSLAIYPEGTILQLNTGETAVVVKSYRALPTRPRVRIISNEEWKTSAETIELSTDPNYFITKVLENY